ncbi:MAG: hypothetical protein JJU06_09300 [Ectothiorhodospiraceae bacterium]|nr:hypothetical protein [Ectothiorhodospiraceae bacterium]MCH8504377.1 hypothetical protein [Ectothiorhodospiraceae bacterium]
MKTPNPFDAWLRFARSLDWSAARSSESSLIAFRALQGAMEHRTPFGKR